MAKGNMTEKGSVQIELSDWFRRDMALWADLVVVGIVCAVCATIVEALDLPTQPKVLGGVLLFALASAYSLVGNSRGQTLGKKLVSIKVVREDGGTCLGLRRSAVRMAAGCPFLLSRIFLWNWTHWRDTTPGFYDKLTHTLVVNASSKEWTKEGAAILGKVENSRICPLCKAQLEYSGRLCPKCGPIGAEGTFVAIPRQKIKCPECGVSLEYSGRFCPKCGPTNPGPQE